MAIRTEPRPLTIISQHIEHVFNTRMDRLRMRHLRLLDLIARTGSLSAAAQAIGMSQPGATKMLQELELAFGCPLIERSAKGGELTVAGSHVLHRMRVALHSVSTARTSVDTRKELPTLRLGIIPLVGIHALCQVVGAMQSANALPRMQIRLGTVEALLQALNEGNVDCVVGFLDGPSSLENIHKFQLTTLWQEKLVVVASSDHPLASCQQVSLARTREFDWVLLHKSSSSRQATDRLFLQAGLEPPNPLIETESFHIGLSIVAGSQMVSAVPESAYRQYQSRLSLLPMETKFTPSTLLFVTHSDGPMLPHVDMLSRQFQAYAKTLEASNLTGDQRIHP